LRLQLFTVRVGVTGTTVVRRGIIREDKKEKKVRI
jgi:hypothetical protein